MATIGTAGLVAQHVGVLDDGLRAVGIRPHAKPDPRDVALLAQAAQDQAALLAALDTAGQQDHQAVVADLRAVLSEQLVAVSDEKTTPPSAGAARGAFDFSAFADRVEAAAAARADGALTAGSLAVVKVLASMSAGLEQVAVASRGLA